MNRQIKSKCEHLESGHECSLSLYLSLSLSLRSADEMSLGSHQLILRELYRVPQKACPFLKIHDIVWPTAAILRQAQFFETRN